MPEAVVQGVPQPRCVGSGRRALTVRVSLLARCDLTAVRLAGPSRQVGCSGPYSEPWEYRAPRGGKVHQTALTHISSPTGWTVGQSASLPIALQLQNDNDRQPSRLCVLSFKQNEVLDSFLSKNTLYYICTKHLQNGFVCWLDATWQHHQWNEKHCWILKMQM